MREPRRRRTRARRPVSARSYVEELFTRPFYGVSPTLTRQGALAVKRAIDVVGTLFLLVLTFPLLAVVALLIRISSRGPVIFRQVRSGFHGRAFKMYKLRTMVADAGLRRSEVRGPEATAALRGEPDQGRPATAPRHAPRSERIMADAWPSTVDFDE